MIKSNIKVKKSEQSMEKVLYDMFKDNPKYDFYSCSEHGLQAHNNDIEYNGCTFCKRKTEKLSKEELEKL